MFDKYISLLIETTAALYCFLYLPDNEGDAPLLEPYMRVLYPESL